MEELYNEALDQEVVRSRFTTMAENFRTRMGRAVVLGAAALSLVGCSVDAEEAQVHQETAIEYQADPGVDSWPVLPSNIETSLYGTDYISGQDINTQISVDARVAGEQPRDAYEAYYNQEPEDATTYELLPSGTTAPVLTVKLGSDGQLHYDAVNVGTNHSTTEESLLRAVDDNRSVLTEAMMDGSLSALHVRVYEPNQNAGSTLGEPDGGGYFIESDSNEGERPAAYVYIGANELAEADRVGLTVGHEARHGIHMTDYEDDFTEQESSVIAEACVSLRDSAEEDMLASNRSILTNLRYIREMSPDYYRPAIDSVIRDMAQGVRAEDTSPAEDKRASIHAAGDLKDCYWRNPYQAIVQTAEDTGLQYFNYSESLNDEDAMAYEDALNDAVETWHRSVKASTVYGQLNESAVLPYGTVNQTLGHSYENAAEFTATLSNLVEQEPAMMVEMVNNIPGEQRLAVIQAARSLYENEVRSHNLSRSYLKQIHAAYNEFFRGLGANADLPLPPDIQPGVRYKTD